MSSLVVVSVWVVWIIQGGRGGVLPGGGVGALGGIYAAHTQAGTPRGSSARRAVLRVNWSFRASLTDSITLIINYLGVPLGMAFTKWYTG